MSDLIDRIKKRIIDEPEKYFIYSIDDLTRVHTVLRIIDEESAKEEQNVCEWSKGLHSYITCWSDVAIKDYKKYAMRFCPHCGRKIRVI